MSRFSLFVLVLPLMAACPAAGRVGITATARPAAAVSFLYVRTHDPAPFPDPHPRPGQWLVWQFLPLTYEEPGTFRTPTGTVVQQDQRPSLASLRNEPGFAEPPERVWLIGPGSVCEATVDRQPWLDIDHVESAVGIVTLALHGCENAKWAPLALVGPEAEARHLSWTPAGPEQILEGRAGVPGATAHDPLLQYWYARIETTFRATSLGAARERPLGTWKLAISTVPGSQPQAVHAHYAVQWPAREASACAWDWEEKVEVGTFSPGTHSPLTYAAPSFSALPSRDLIGTQVLVGAFSAGGRTQAIVLMDHLYSASLQPLPGAETMFSRGPHAWPTLACFDEDWLRESFFSCDGI